jgi:hypothetical protein
LSMVLRSAPFVVCIIIHIVSILNYAKIVILPMLETQWGKKKLEIYKYRQCSRYDVPNSGLGHNGCNKLG